MTQPEEQLKNISFDEEVYHVLCTPNRLKKDSNDFQGWSDVRQHPLDSPERKPPLNIGKKPNPKSNSFRLSISQHSTMKNLHIQNKQNYSISPYELQKTMKIMQLIDQQVLSPKSRKIITPFHRASNKSVSQKFCTPIKSHRTRDISIRKIAQTERLHKPQSSRDIIRQKIHENENKEILTSKNTNEQDLKVQFKQDSFKIPLSAILYPVLKLNTKRPVRRMERFQTFVARTVRK